MHAFLDQRLEGSPYKGDESPRRQFSWGLGRLRTCWVMVERKWVGQQLPPAASLGLSATGWSDLVVRMRHLGSRLPSRSKAWVAALREEQRQVPSLVGCGQLNWLLLWEWALRGHWTLSWWSSGWPRHITNLHVSPFPSQRLETENCSCPLHWNIANVNKTLDESFLRRCFIHGPAISVEVATKTPRVPFTLFKIFGFTVLFVQISLKQGIGFLVEKICFLWLLQIM